MRISRFLTEEHIKLAMTTRIEPLEEGTSLEKWRLEAKEKILSELVTLLEKNGRVGNRTKFLLDFINREKKATTSIGNGIAIPHIRSLQAKEFMIAFARSIEGYDFEALDNKPTHLFFIMAAPPYDDTLYLKVFKALAEMLRLDSFREELMTVNSPGEVIRAIRALE
ncbi:MAG: PTS sugar transporter subunit IIA [candidate division Zixibacteria bacterium]|nr:PTS sugar transporter subunit IIA [candidate division Zixibacteria bacterium]MDD5425037.1 PTS sugar transporter subunit IIA [candidate division Zixibacteria bacterium]